MKKFFKGKNSENKIDKCPNCQSQIGSKDNFCRTCGQDLRDYWLEKESDEKKGGLEEDLRQDERPALPDNTEKIRALDQRDFDYRTDYDDLYKEESHFKSSTYLGSIFESVFKRKDKPSDTTKDDLPESKEDTKASQVKEKPKTIDTRVQYQNDKDPKTQTDIDQDDGNDLGREKSLQKDLDKAVPMPTGKDLSNTSRLPNINQAMIEEEERRKLSEEKRKRLEESKAKALDNENFILDKDMDLDQTQKIDLEEVRRLETEIRKIRLKEENNKKSKPKLAKGRASRKGPGKKSKLNVKKFGPALIVLLILILALSLGAYGSSKGRFVKDLEGAIINKNVEKIQKLTIGQDGRGLYKEEAQALMDLIEDDRLFRSAILSAINEDAQGIGKEDTNPNRIYKLAKVGRKYLIYPNYKLVLDYIDVGFKNQAGDIKPILGGTEFVNSGDIVKMTPGLYDLVIEEKNFEDKVRISNTVKGYENRDLVLDLANLGAINTASEEAIEDEAIAKESEETEKLDLKGQVNLKLEGDKDSRVYINGKDTGYSLGELNALEGIDIKEGDLVKLEKDLPWGPGFSEEQAYQGQESINLSVELLNEETRKILTDTCIEVLKEDAKAREEMSMDAYTRIMEPEISEAKKVIDSEVANNTIYYRDYRTFWLDPSSIEVIENADGTYDAYVGGILEYGLGEVAPEYLRDFEPMTSIETRGFHLTFKDGAWYVNLWGYTDRYVNQNTDELIEMKIN